MTTAITVENLGKRYRLGHAVQRATSAREALKNAALSPFRYLKWRMSPMTGGGISITRPPVFSSLSGLSNRCVHGK